jgi:3D (Asp-Asp-Asp) domain-containing protein
MKNALKILAASLALGLVYGAVFSVGFRLLYGEIEDPAPVTAAGAGRTATTATTEAHIEGTPDEPIEAPTEETTEEAPETVAEPEPISLGTFKLTAYCSCPACCGSWADGTTYTGTKATAGRTIAVDPDVIPLGSTVYINGQPYIAEDIGGAIQGNRIDVYFPTHQDAIEFGVQYAEISIF